MRGITCASVGSHLDRNHRRRLRIRVPARPRAPDWQCRAPAPATAAPRWWCAVRVSASADVRPRSSENSARWWMWWRASPYQQSERRASSPPGGDAARGSTATDACGGGDRHTKQPVREGDTPHFSPLPPESSGRWGRGAGVSLGAWVRHKARDDRVACCVSGLGEVTTCQSNAPPLRMMAMLPPRGERRWWARRS